jgi:TetR/AcrR family transcriptional regulator, regulator of cefoperazone and chloramphenicol sensitivity
MRAMTTMPHDPAVGKETRKPRADGTEARARLLHTALRLFAERGYAKTSTRDIAQASGINIASIKYYFGDKAGLYRAVFTEPLGSPRDDIPLYDQPHFSLRESLEGFFTSFLAPLKQDELIQLCMRLHFREMLEPTGLWTEEINSGIKPAHAALAAVLCRHLDLAKPDDDVHRLAFSIAGLAIQLFVARDVVSTIRSQLIDTPEAIDRWTARLVEYAEAMLGAEAVRRNLTSSSKQPNTGKKNKP